MRIVSMFSAGLAMTSFSARQITFPLEGPSHGTSTVSNPRKNPSEKSSRQHTMRSGPTALITPPMWRKFLFTGTVRTSYPISASNADNCRMPSSFVLLDWPTKATVPARMTSPPSTVPGSAISPTKGISSDSRTSAIHVSSPRLASSPIRSLMYPRGVTSDTSRVNTELG